MHLLPDNDRIEKQRLQHYLLGSWTDRILLVAVLGGILFGWMHVRTLAGGGIAMVDIYHGPTLLAEYPLRGKTPVHFAAEGEIGVSDIIIADGAVFISESPCRSKRCIRSGHQHRIGDSIACVPNHILVAIRGDAKAFDAVVE